VISCVRVFSDRAHYNREQRAQLADILRPYWKDVAFSEQERQDMYGLSFEDFQVVDNLAQGDLAVLPMTWNHYLKHGVMSQARDFVNAARRVGRPILSYVSGDEGVTVPAEFDDVYVVRVSGFRSEKRQRQVAQPVFFEDPLKRYPELESYDRPVGAEPRPMIGFCGQSSVNLMKLGVDVVRGCCRNIQFHLGYRQEEPQPVYPPTFLRARAMKVLAASPLLKTRFISRARYRGGATDDEMRERTSREFYENIAETDYTLCVRGGGNFSKRFYETLAMGRIPVLVDTDCLLPFEPDLHWDDYIVRVSRDDLKSLPRRIAGHFASLNKAGLEEQKRKCRQMWSEWLSFGNYHRRIARLILETP
jgi:hypothetical protein